MKAEIAIEDLAPLRDEIRRWVDENFPAELAGLSEDDRDPVLASQWRLSLGKKGWYLPEWEVEFGGAGFDKKALAIFDEELRRVGAYSPNATRERVFGETLKHFGNPQQKATHLPRMARGEIKWCQGFSEPGAGSDLASLQMRCEDTPDGYLLNGQKIWTSGALDSQWCFCLVRTDTSQKHGGISFILVDMSSPGFEVRPIKLIDGTSPFCESFLTDVLVPKENILGELNQGWDVARFQLQVERKYVATSKSHGMIPGPSLDQLAVNHIGVDDNGRLLDSDLRSRLAHHLIREQAFNLTFQRARGPAVASILKNAGSSVRQTRAELAVEILGQQGLGWAGEAFTADQLETTKAFLFGKSASIAAGSFEVNYNILAKRILGLPDIHTKA